MSVLGITALILVVVLGLLVLRVKSDPMEDESVRKYLAESSTDKQDPAGGEDEAKAQSLEHRP